MESNHPEQPHCPGCDIPKTCKTCKTANDTIVSTLFLSPFPGDAPGRLQPEQRDETRAVEQDFHTRIQRFKEDLLRESLQQNGHNQRRTAEALGLNYDQIRGLMRKFKMMRPDT